MKRTISNQFATFWIEEGILHFIYHPAVIIDLDAAEKVLADRLSIQEDKDYPVLCDIRGLKDTDKAARDFLAKEGSVLTRAVAFLINGPVSDAIVDFYIRNSKPVTPTRVFTQEYDAIQFLKPYRRKKF